MIIDAENLILGRIASFVAKKALLGEKVEIINCEKAIVSGNKRRILAMYRNRKERGTHSKGPFMFKDPERFFKRTIRGMLPYKKEIGKKAFKNIKCYRGIPDNFKDKKAIKIEGADVAKIPNLKYITVKDICKMLGAKI